MWDMNDESQAEQLHNIAAKYFSDLVAQWQSERPQDLHDADAFSWARMAVGHFIDQLPEADTLTHYDETEKWLKSLALNAYIENANRQNDAIVARMFASKDVDLYRLSVTGDMDAGWKFEPVTPLIETMQLPRATRSEVINAALKRIPMRERAEMDGVSAIYYTQHQPSFTILVNANTGEPLFEVVPAGTEPQAGEYNDNF